MSSDQIFERALSGVVVCGSLVGFLLVCGNALRLEHKIADLEVALSKAPKAEKPQQDFSTDLWKGI